MAITTTSLHTVYNNLVTTLAAEIAFEAANGAKPSYSVGNRSVDWNGYRSSIIKQIEDLALLISKIDSFDITQQAIPGNRSNSGGWVM
jgi:hypothetical protein